MMEGKLIKVNDIYTLMVNDKMFASNDEDFQKDYEVDKLSFKNCQAIENGYDLDELAEEEAKKRHDWNKHRDTDIYNELVREDAELIKIGFQKALEILGNKKFSEKDIERAFIQGVYTKTEIHRKKEEYIQSLQQTEWDVTFNFDEKDADGCLILKRK